MYVFCKINFWKMLRMIKYSKYLLKYFIVLLFVVYIIVKFKININFYVIQNSILWFDKNYIVV